MAGEILDIVYFKHLLITWDIPNYYSFSQKTDTYIESPDFQYLQERWSLRIYPNGRRTNNSVESIGIYLKKLTFKTASIPSIAGIGILDINGVNVNPENHSITYNFAKESMWGNSHYMDRLELLRNQRNIFNDDSLLVFIQLNLPDKVCHASTQTTSIDSVSTLTKDFHSLLNGEKNSDVTIKVEKQTFKAHKLILGARSSVFSAMFEHGMRESYTGQINIEDCDPEIFEEFLVFIYTGKIENLSSNNVTGLFALADKYDVAGLKEESIIFMKDNLCLDTVYDVLSTAYKHNETELAKSAKELLVKNIKIATSNPKWFSFMQENPVLATEVMMPFIH